MPVTPPIAPAGTPVERQTPDRPIDQSLVRPASYTLSPGDRINVAIANVPEYSNVYQVMMDGCITLPVVGALDVQGMTETQAALAIAQRYTETQVLVQPTVTVILAEMSQVHVAVLGEVNRPGAYLITPPNGELPKLTQMIEQAGGITPHTNLKAIEIHRPLRDGTMQVIAANLWSLLTTGDLSQDIAIRDGDTVMLKPATDMPLEVALSVSRANVTPSDIQVNILGEVTSPGVQTLVSGTSLNQALMFAGGFTGRARRRSVELIRLNVNGTVSRRRVEIDLDQSINEDSNPILQSQDVILVNRSLEARITDTIGNILSPINSIFSLFDVFSPFLGR
jgi:polysaccharide export outer membrane protein